MIKQIEKWLKALGLVIIIFFIVFFITQTQVSKVVEKKSETNELAELPIAGVEYQMIGEKGLPNAFGKRREFKSLIQEQEIKELTGKLEELEKENEKLKRENEKLKKW